MSDVRPILWLIPVLPLAACAITAFLGPRLLRRQSHWPCVLAFVASFILSCFVLRAVAGAPEAVEGETTPHPAQQVAVYYPWITVGVPDTAHALDIGFALRADALTAAMLVMITFVSTFIAIYSIGYMHGDEGYARFFAEVSLFVFMMTTLVMADNFILLYLGWEGVGLCSYLLIGFWFTKPSAAAAARKAFLVTRIGDMGFLIGILLLWVSFGYDLRYDHVFEQAGTLPHGLLVMVCLLLFCGAVGKSAQFPLYVWLPDAMEGPTPVSALIHAATMVTAGVYMVARCTPMFKLAPEAQLVVGCIGGFTAIFAAAIALTQFDLKRVLAYSTLSQLGYMFLALGSGVLAAGAHGEVHFADALVIFAVVAAMFHLITHAFFKALLFMASGSVMHAMGNVIDMRRFGGLRRVMPTTHWTFLCGALALAGFPFLSGFWSKDDVLAATWMAGHDSPYGAVYFLLWAVGMVTAFLTAFYTFRAYFLTFWGELRVPEEAGHHGHHGHEAREEGGHHHGPADAHRPTAEAHGQAAPQASYESPPVMTVPLIVLAVFAVGVGFVLGPLGPGAIQFAPFLERAPVFAHKPAGVEEHMNVILMVVSGIVALAGIGLAYLMYVRRPGLPGQLARSAQGLYQMSLNKFHGDELYDSFILKPLKGVTQFARIFDQYVIDALVDLLGHIPRLAGFLLRPIQNGLVQFYALAMILGLTVFLIALMRSL